MKLESVYFRRSRILEWMLCSLLLIGSLAHAQTDPLPSWNDGPAKQAIVAFVQATTTQSSPGFVPPAERVATFDEDGTMWVEHPMYAEIMFTLDRVAQLAQKHPEWKDQPPLPGPVAARGRAPCPRLWSSTHGIKVKCGAQSALDQSPIVDRLRGAHSCEDVTAMWPRPRLVIPGPRSGSRNPAAEIEKSNQERRRPIGYSRNLEGETVCVSVLVRVQ